jgi:glucose/mannose-6-phosphate isomerase
VTLDDARVFEERDPHRVRDVFAAFPLQCREALRLEAEPAVLRRRPSLVVVAGMGGSAAGGDLLAACAGDRLDVPCLVHRGYGLPASVGAHALVIAASYSGDTAETLSAVEVALARGAAVVVLTSGGRLAGLATAHRLPRVTLPPGFMPRMALGHLFFPMVRVLAGLGLPVASDTELVETVDVLGAMAGELGPESPLAGNEAKRLALALEDRMPVIYGGPGTASVAYRWKTDLEENAKLLALAGALPEMNHNSIEAWRAPAARGLHLVLLRDAEEPPEIARRFALLRELVAPAAGGIGECRARGTGHVARLLSLTYVGMWVSYYAAMARGVEPWSVPLLDELKRRLG